MPGGAVRPELRGTRSPAASAPPQPGGTGRPTDGGARGLGGAAWPGESATPGPGFGAARGNLVGGAAGAAHAAGGAATSSPAAFSATHPDPAEAGAFAGAFAVDYLSWDEDDPGRRGRVLRDYLRPPAGDPALLGWSGTGRQRGEFALPGLVRPDGESRVLVDVRVRVTPYRAVGDRTPDGSASAEPDCGLAGVPAVAPAPTGRGWRSLASCWVRLSVPVTHEGGRLVVDAWEETIGLAEPAGDAEVAGPADHLLVDDDPLAEAAE